MPGCFVALMYRQNGDLTNLLKSYCFLQKRIILLHFVWEEVEVIIEQMQRKEQFQLGNIFTAVHRTIYLVAVFPFSKKS